MAHPESITLPLKIVIFLVFMSLAVTSAAELEKPTISPEEPDSAETLVSSTVPPVVTNNIGEEHHPLSFFMHDILGGSNPTARAVTGVVTNPALNAQVAFAKPNGANLPLNNGIPQNNNNNGFLNNNNIPFLTGLGGNPGNGMTNNGNNLINGFPVTNVNQLPAGMTLQKLMSGTMTVFDDELTEGHELGSGLVGKAQGFYLASAVDGTSQILAFTAKFEENGYADSISFFGVHRTQVSESQLAIMGGNGKYLNAQGYAIIKTFPLTNEQHNTDGSETLLQLTLFLAY